VVDSKENKIDEFDRLKAINIYTSMFLHDARNSFASISAYITTMLDWIPLLQKQQPHIQDFLDEFIHQVKYLRLVLVKMTLLGGTGTSHREPHDVVEIFQDCLELFKKRFEKQSIEVEIGKERDIPNIVCDESLLLQVFLNLLLNTYEVIYLSQTHHPMVNVSFKRIDPNKIRITYMDNGPGVNEQLIDDVFKAGGKNGVRP
jgi:signal transduction histidine kinase